LAPYSVQTRLYAARPRGRKGMKKRKSRSQRLFAFPLQFRGKRRTPSTAPREWPRLRTVAPGGTSAPRRAAFRGSLLGAAATVRRGRRPGQGTRHAKRCTLRGFAARSGHAALVGPGQHGHEQGGDRDREHEREDRAPAEHVREDAADERAGRPEEGRAQQPDRLLAR
jgi:hypothetical protein